MRAFLAVAVLCVGCSDPSTHGNVLSNLQQHDGGSGADGGEDAGTDAGQCTPQSEIPNWPVKVLVVLEQSGHMCVLDPPGSQGAAGGCESAEALIQANSDGGLPVEPARVRGLKQLMLQLQSQPNVQLALQPFETSSVQLFPVGGGFARPDGQLDLRVSALQSELGKGADLQGALLLAKEVLRADMAHTSATAPQLLPQTKYVVLLLSSGIPVPRCSSQDNLTTYADALHPDGIWPDDVTPLDGGFDPDCLGYTCGAPSQQGGGGGGDAGTPLPLNICNAQCDFTFPESCLTDTLLGQPQPGDDRNQNAQLTDAVDQLVALRTTYGAGDVRLHTALLYDTGPVDLCGGFCGFLFYPENTRAMRGSADWLMRELALHGQGTFHDLGSPASTDLSWLDTAPFTTFCP